MGMSRRSFVTTLVTTLALVSIAPAADIPQLDRMQLPGRPVKVAAICIGFGGRHEEKLELALDHLRTAGRNGVDIACLPEEFAGTRAEPVPGPTTQAVAALARQYNMYVICPLREQAGRRQYNTAVLLDRKGRIAGRYRKVFVFWGEGLHCGTEGAKVFETDFGRIGILTCFDLNFPELWQQCDDLNAEIVFWPSAYGGGSPLNAMATLFHYYVVPVGAGNIIDITGRPVEPVEKPRPRQFVATLDLDRTFAHHDFNRDKVAKMLDKHKGEIEVERNLSPEDLAPWWLFRSIQPGLRVRDVLQEHGIEPLRDYQHRSRRQINEAREKGEKI